MFEAPFSILVSDIGSLTEVEGDEDEIPPYEEAELFMIMGLRSLSFSLCMLELS